VGGWIFYIVKRWKTPGKVLGAGQFIEKMAIRLAGLIASMLVGLLTMSAILSGLQGVHRGFIGGLYFVVLLMVCILILELSWKAAKRIFGIQI